MTILLPRFRHIRPNKPFVSKVGISCEVRGLLYDANMNLRQDTGWHGNTIFNNGLDQLWSSSWLGYTSIGTGTGATDVAIPILETPVGGITTVIGAGDGVNVAAIAPDYQYSRTRSRRFGAGIGTGLITEAGAGYSATMGTNMYNRVLLPVAIDKQPENVLDIILRQTVWPDLTDHISTAVFKGITYDTITRIRNCTAGDFNGSAAWDSFRIIDGGTASWTAWDGAIGSITDANPAGSKDNGGTGAGWSSETYVNGNFYRDIRYGAGLNDWVLPAEHIRCLIGDLHLIHIQTQFTEAAGEPNPGDPVPKDATEIMDFAWRYVWGRKP